MSNRAPRSHDSQSLPSSNSLTLAIVGDVHNQWDADDAVALRALNPDLVLFVGDFGNEAVEIVRSIAELNIPKAVILGNHDAWYTASAAGRSRCPYDAKREDRVQQQLDLLGDAHVGYGYRDFPAWGLSVVGGRPFSLGGSEWKNAEFYQARFGIRNFQDSTDRIVAMAAAATSNTIVLLGHCGPWGLGDRPDDPCGKDWPPIGGDHGEPDLAVAIEQIRELGKTIPLVTFGHMHHALRYTQAHPRRAVHVDAAGTVYLNAAAFPRVLPMGPERIHQFSQVTWINHQVTTAQSVWVSRQGQIRSQTPLYEIAMAPADYQVQMSII